MSYYEALGLEKEPFSTSPDPDFFYNSIKHGTALKRLEIAIRLRRGLSVVLGDVGTGKTTLMRTLLKSFKDEENYVFHMILDPHFKSEFQFLFALSRIFGIEPQVKSIMDFKEALEKYLFYTGVNENKTIVLLIDEGQKMTLEDMEVLRTLLNYETNNYKLLQLVIMAQTELLPRIKCVHNFMDRVALKYTLSPLNETETRDIIEFRLAQAGCNNHRGLFSEEAINIIYQYTQGYPRRIAMICHQALEAIVMKDRWIVDADTVNSLVSQEAEL